MQACCYPPVFSKIRISSEVCRCRMLLMRMWHLRKNYTERNFFLLEKNAFEGTTNLNFPYICTRKRRPKESCQSGRMGRTRNAVYGQLYRGFESLSLRKTTRMLRQVTSSFCFSCASNCLIVCPFSVPFLLNMTTPGRQTTDYQQANIHLIDILR